MEGLESLTSYRKFAYVYDELMADMPYSDWLSFAHEAWERYGQPETVVDLGCGTGSITIPLLDSGLTVTGIDLSADMLSVARQRLDSTALGARLYHDGRVNWVQQNMTAWELPEPVDSVISFCDCINYLLEEEEVIRTFQRTYQGLKPGGTFLFDVHHPDTLRRYDEEQPFVLDEDAISYIWTCEFEDEKCEIEHHLTIFAREAEPGADLYRRFEEYHIQRAYDPAWMKQELLRCGFREVHCYADFTWVEAEESEDVARLFYVAVK